MVTRLRASLTGPDQRAVCGFFVVEMEAVVAVPDGVDAFVQRDPFVAGSMGCREAPRRVIGRRDRVLRERMQDVGQHQFLMLLLVIEPDLDQRHQSGEGVLIGRLEEFHHRGVDMAAIGGDFVGARAGQMAALVTGMARAGADVIGIEQIGIIGVKAPVAVASARRAEIARRTRWCGRGATSPGWRPASTGSAGLPETGGRHGARSRPGPPERLPPNSWARVPESEKAVTGRGGRGGRSGYWFRHWCLRSRERTLLRRTGSLAHSPS